MTYFQRLNAKNLFAKSACMFVANILMTHLPLYAVQRSASGRWLVRVLDSDPLLPPVLTVAALDESQPAYVGSHRDIGEVSNKAC